MKLRIQSEEGQWVVYKETAEPGLYDKLDPAEDRITCIVVDTEPEPGRGILSITSLPEDEDDRDGV